MRVIFTNNVTHDTSRFFVWFVPVVTQLMHRKQYTTMHRF